MVDLLVVLVCLPIVCAASGSVFPGDRIVSDADMKSFLKSIEGQKDFVQSWTSVEQAAKARHVAEEIGLSDWKRLLEMSRTAGIKSRCALELHPSLKKPQYFDELIHSFGHDSDLFTRARVFSFMQSLDGANARCPRFGLLLLLESWNDSWPESIELHGNSPRDVLLLELSKQWNIPPGKLTADICGKILSQSNEWAFNKALGKWSIPNSQAWLPQLPMQ
jgi:hypothetical protein